MGIIKLIKYSAITFLIILTACGGNGNDSSLDKQTGTVTFAVFGNTGRVTDDGRIFRGFVQQINDSGADFAVDLGNRLPVGLSSTGIEVFWNVIDREMEQFSIPVYPVVGKNDIFDYESDIIYSRRYGYVWYAFERNGVHFIVLNTDDEAYSEGFGIKAKISEEQFDFLYHHIIESNSRNPIIVFMNRPVWVDEPSLWRENLLPVFREGKVDLVVTCSDRGLFDWGLVDGIRAVSTGCAGPVEEKRIGLYPHVLTVTTDGSDYSFEVLLSDGTKREGIWINKEVESAVDKIAESLTIPVLNSEQSWRVTDVLTLEVTNSFDFTISGDINFTNFKSTSWNINPSALHFSINPSVKKTFNINIRGTPPALGPLPLYNCTFKIGDTDAWAYNSQIKVKVPYPRTGETVPISAQIPDVIPYSFEKKSLRFPVEIDQADICGRLIIYNEKRSELPVCLHVSSLRNLKPGLNEFIWNGRDLEGKRAFPDTLTYRMFLYNKKAPATWVASGPPSLCGTVNIERTLSGLRSNCLVIVDGRTGDKFSVLDLGEFFGENIAPPSISVTDQGLYSAHPDCEYVLYMTHFGEILWINDANNRVVGTDVDGKSFIHGIGVDRFGFSYINTPGYSARCGVLGPDGLGLFRVILVQLPGLRVSSVVPVIEGKNTDGLYFITRGGDKPYVFHVPYTIRTGIIVDEIDFIQY